MAGKGSRQRPSDPKKFNEEFERIFGKPKARKGGNAKPTQPHIDKKKEQKKRGIDDGE